MKGAQQMELPKKDVFEECVRMKCLSFPENRKFDNYYFVRPDVLIQGRDVDSLKNPFSKFTPQNIYDLLIWYPTEQDIISRLGLTLKTINFSVTSGVWVYTDVKNENGEDIRGNGVTLWFALADAWCNAKREQDKTLIDISIPSPEK